MNSCVNGIITEMTIIQGTAKVKVGDIVRIGQEVVSPVIKDSNGNELLVKPIADIKADIFYTQIIEVPDDKLQEVLTGNKIKTKQIFLFGVEIFNSNITIDFKYYTKQIIETYLTPNNILPIKVIQTTYNEFEYVLYNNYFEENKEYILDELKQKTRQNVRSYDIIKDEYYNITNSAKVNRITYTVLASGSVFN